jgi:hypothetical protein
MEPTRLLVNARGSFVTLALFGWVFPVLCVFAWRTEFIQVR